MTSDCFVCKNGRAINNQVRCNKTDRREMDGIPVEIDQKQRTKNFDFLVLETDN